MDLFTYAMAKKAGGSGGGVINVEFTPVYDDPTAEEPEMTGVTTTTAISDMLAAHAAGKRVHGSFDLDSFKAESDMNTYTDNMVSFPIVVPEFSGMSATVICIGGFINQVGDDIWNITVGG